MDTFLDNTPTPQTCPPLARLSTQAESCYSEPVRIPVGSGFCAELPAPNGEEYPTTLRRWDAAATAIAKLAGIGRPGWVSYTRLDQRRHGWLECTLAHPAMVATQLLTHPRLAMALAAELADVCEGPVAFYVRGDQVQACPLPLAITRNGWHGPFDLRTGFCVAFELLERKPAALGT